MIVPSVYSLTHTLSQKYKTQLSCIYSCACVDGRLELAASQIKMHSEVMTCVSDVYTNHTWGLTVTSWVGGIMGLGLGLWLWKGDHKGVGGLVRNIYGASKPSLKQCALTAGGLWAATALEYWRQSVLMRTDLRGISSDDKLDSFFQNLYKKDLQTGDGIENQMVLHRWQKVKPNVKRALDLIEIQDIEPLQR